MTNTLQDCVTFVDPELHAARESLGAAELSPLFNNKSHGKRSRARRQPSDSLSTTGHSATHGRSQGARTGGSLALREDAGDLPGGHVPSRHKGQDTLPPCTSPSVP